MVSNTVVSSVTDTLSDWIDGRINDVLNEVDLTDTHVLDSRSLNTTEHSSIGDQVNDAKNEVIASRNQEDGHFNTLHNDHGTIESGISSLSTQLSNTRNDVLSSFTDTDNSITALSSQVSTDYNATVALINSRSDTIDGEVGAANNRLNTLTNGATKTLGSVESTLHNDHNTIEVMLAYVESKLNTLTAALAAQRKAQPSYTVVAETDWDTKLEWAQPADFFIVEVTTVGAQQGSQPSGVTRYPHVGWCAPMGAGGAIDQLQQIDFAKRVVTSVGVVMIGLLLYCKPGTGGHVQACMND